MTQVLSQHRMVSRGLQMVEVCAALEIGLPRGQASARHYRDRFQTRAPPRSQGSMGGTKSLTIHAGQAQ